MLSTRSFLDDLGVIELPPLTTPFDSGYDPGSVISHLEQSSHLMSALKISMACWLIADERCTRRKLEAAIARGVPTVAGGASFEVALAQGRLEGYLELCAEVGLTRIECAEGFTELSCDPKEVVRRAGGRGLGVDFELGQKHAGPFDAPMVERLLAQGRAWLDAGAQHLIIEARESARAVGLFDRQGEFNRVLAERFVTEFGFGLVVFEAPTKASQFAMLDHFGPGVRLANVRLEELLRVEIYRRGLHSDAFGVDRLRPHRPG